MVDKFQSALHPRGADGRFIEKFGIIKFLKDAKWQYGKVQDITADPNGNISVQVDESDLAGNPTGEKHVLSPKQIYQAPKPTGYLKIGSPKAKKVGGQAGSNPGGLYELPVAEGDGPGLEKASDLPDWLPEEFQGEPGQPLKVLTVNRDSIDPKSNKKVTTPITDVYARNEAGNWQKINSFGGKLVGKEYTDAQMDDWQSTFKYDINNAYYKPQSLVDSAVPGGADTASNKWYVKKAKTAAHGRNEALANELYAALGVPVPEVVYDESDGNIYSKIVPGTPDMASQLKSQEFIDQIKANFAVDAWLANWDVFGMTWDNVMTDANGVPFRIDNGGSLLYRAQGSAKGSDFGADVSELKSFKTGKKSQVFGGITKEQELDGAQRILALRPGEIKDLVTKHNLPPSLADTLIARRKSVADHYGLDLPEDVATIPVDTVDLTTSGGKERHWKSAPLASIAPALQTGDLVEINGQPVVYGDSPGLPYGSTAAKQVQMSNWIATQGADTEVWFSQGVSDKPRPDHGDSMLLAELANHSWDRGDRIVIEGIGPMEIIGINEKTGVALLLPEGEKAPLAWSLRYQGDQAVMVDLWDKKVTAKPGVSIYPSPETQPDGEQTMPQWEQDWAEALWPSPAKPQAPAAMQAIKTDIETAAKEQQTASSGKSMTLGDGTEADTGAKLFSAKDGKHYVYVKKKGPYAVVTDPESDDPAKPLTKLASTLSQPDKAPTAIPEAGGKEPPKSANGVLPKVGMTATAKDGHTGTITMVSPDGKFVFITDSSGKKKRKSVGTVTIDSTDAVDAVPEPVVSTNDQGQTTVSVPPVEDVEDVETVKALYPEAASWWPTPSQWEADGDRYWSAKIEPDGSYGMVPVSAMKLDDVFDGYITTPDGKLAGFDIDNAALLVDMDVAKQAAMNAGDFHYGVLINGQWWNVVPSDAFAGELAIFRYGDNGQEFLVITKGSGKLPMQRFSGSLEEVEIPLVVATTKINPPLYDEFTPLNQLGLAKGDKVSLDGKTWLTVDKVWPGGKYNRYTNDQGDVVYLHNGAGTTVLYQEKPPAVATTVDIPDTDPFAMEMGQAEASMNATLAAIKYGDTGGLNDAKIVTANNMVEEDFVTVQHLDGSTISGIVVEESKVNDALHSLVIHTSEGTEHLTLPKGWPVLLHGTMSTDQQEPVPMSLKQWAGVGVKEGQYVHLDNGAVMKVLGVGPDGAVQMQQTDGQVFGGWYLDFMQEADAPIYHIGSVPPPGIDFPPVEAGGGPDLSAKSHDASHVSQAKKVWDSLPPEIAKPTNTTVYHDPVGNYFYWQNGAGDMVTTHLVSHQQKTQGLGAMTPKDWQQMVSGETVISAPTPSTIKHSAYAEMTFEVIPDHYMVELTGVMWAVPKGGMGDPTTWVAVGANNHTDDGHSELSPNLLIPQTDVSGAKIVVDPDAPAAPVPPKVAQAAPKVPEGWPPHASIAAEKYPGKRMAKMAITNGVYVELAPDEWSYVTGSGDAPIYGGVYTTSQIENANHEMWDPNATIQPTIDLNGNQYGLGAVVKQIPGSTHYYVKEDGSDPDGEWFLVYGNGELGTVWADDLDPNTGEPPGDYIWPPGHRQAEPPVEPHVLGGESTNLTGMTTENDPVVKGLEPQGPNIVWMKADQGTNIGTTYYALDNDKNEIHMWYIPPGWTDPPQDHGTVPMPDNKTANEKYAVIKAALAPGTVYTDVTPGGYVEPETPKLWDDLVVETVNPTKAGYAGLEYKDPEALKSQPPEGWEQADWEYALGYSKTLGPQSKVLMVQTTNDEGKPHAEFWTVSPSGYVESLGVVGSSPYPLIDETQIPDMVNPASALLHAVAGLPNGGDVFDVSDVSPVHHVIGYKPGAPKTPGNQWSVPVSPLSTVFEVSDGYGHLHRDETGKWWLIAPSGMQSHWADNDEAAVAEVKKYNLKLTEYTMHTDDKAPATVPVNVPSTNNKATSSMVYASPTGKTLFLDPGDELYTGETTDGKTYYFLKQADGSWKYASADPNEFALTAWPAGAPQPGSGDTPLKPVDIGGTSVPQPAPPTVPVAHTSTYDVPDPSIGDPSATLSQDPVDMKTVDYQNLPAGTWFAYKVTDYYNNNDEEVRWAKVVGTDEYGATNLETWFKNADTGEWESFGYTIPLYASDYPEAYLVQPPSTGVPTPVSTPSIPKPQATAPSGAKYPGSAPPTPEEIASWGGDLTKDGYIPTSGMKVKGKGPMKGTVVSVSKDRTKAVVMTEDGKKTTRLINALNVDHTGNLKTYGTVTHMDIPADMPFAADPPDVAIKKVLTDKEPGQMSGFVLANDGIRDSKVTLVKGVDKDGKPVVRAYFHMTADASAGVPSALAAKQSSPQVGAWTTPSKASGNVAIGDQVAMRLSSSSSKWKVDSNQSEPTHTVTGVQPGPAGVNVVTLKNLKTGEEITSNFHTGKTLTTYVWDPNKPVPVVPGSVVLSPEAKAQGWSKESGAKVSTMVNGVWQPSVFKVNDHYGSGHETYRQTGADGTVIEVVTGNKTHASNGFSAITVPAGEGTDPDKAILAALERIGVGYKPPTQPDFKREVVRRLSTLLSYDKANIDSINGADVNDPNDPQVKALFAKVGQDVGLNDIGWGDVLVGQDHRGDTTFYWSDRVVEAMEKKSKASVVIRAASNGSADVVVSTIMNGSMPGVMRVAEGFSGGASASSDNSNFASYGSYFSQVSSSTLPKSNSLASYKHAGMMVYYRPSAVYRQIKDFRAASNDAFGNPGHGTDSLGKSLSSSSVRDFYVHGGLNADDIGHIAVSNETTRLDAIKKLKAKGVTTIGGRPIEDVIITLAKAGSTSAKNLPLPPPPPNVVPIESVPESYGGGPAGVVAAVDTEEVAA